MATKQDVNDLKKCMRQAGSQAARDVCEATFKSKGGTVVAEGGKVFSSQDGGEAFVTKGGKVF
jgi:hypothetical protein